MVMSNRVARYVVGILGNVISCGLFLSPAPTSYRIWKKKNVEQFQFYPYLAAVLNCMFWLFYGLPIVKPDSILVVTINGFGLVIELFYLAVYCYYDSQCKGRRKVAIGLAGEAILLAVIVTISMLAFNQTKRILFVGILCDIFNVVMYASPLAIVKQVIQTKSVEYMPFYLSLFSFLASSIMTAFGLLSRDLFITSANLMGTLLAILQLVLYCKYRNWVPSEKLPTKQPQVQLQLVIIETFDGKS